MRQIIGRFSRDTKGSIAVITALAAIPMVFLVGMGIDYGYAVDRQTRLNGYADAAALAAVTPSVMVQSAAIAKTAATNMFNGQAENLSNVSYDPSKLAVSIQTVNGQRVATVTYQANYPTFFAKVLGMQTLALGGTSSATAGLPPNINFYLLLDDSPSMAIAATTAGIATMNSHTTSQGQCAFACHETHPATDNLGNPGGEDNYALARNLGVTLRMDLVQQAASSLMTTAQSTETTNGASYGMAIYSFDQALNTIQALTTNLTTAKTAAGTITVLPVYANNYITSTNNNNDTDTNYDAAMTGVNKIMPNPGSGTGLAGDTPQEVLFFVTDGVEDENVSGQRQQSVMDPGWCTTIKNRGIRIAVVYTIYYPITINSWYNTYIAPIQSNIGPSLQNCASPGLYYAVDVGGDISAALNSLFQYAVQSAYLSK
jgi:Flp pilus assembly protein TadG